MSQNIFFKKLQQQQQQQQKDACRQKHQNIFSSFHWKLQIMLFSDKHREVNYIIRL